MATTLINPPDLATPRGFSHGAIGTGRLLFIAGQTGTDKEGKLVSDDLVAQFDQALGGVVRVVQEAGGEARRYSEDQPARVGQTGVPGARPRHRQSLPQAPRPPFPSDDSR